MRGPRSDLAVQREEDVELPELDELADDLDAVLLGQPVRAARRLHRRQRLLQLPDDLHLRQCEGRGDERS